MTVEEKALALVNEALVESGWECFSLAIAQTRYDYGFEALAARGYKIERIEQ